MTNEKKIEDLEHMNMLLREHIEQLKKTFEYEVRRPRLLRNVVEKLKDGNYLARQVVDVRRTPDGEEIVISSNSGEGR